MHSSNHATHTNAEERKVQTGEKPGRAGVFGIQLGAFRSLGHEDEVQKNAQIFGRCWGESTLRRQRDPASRQ